MVLFCYHENMYKIPVEIKESAIDGKGVFSKQAVKKGTIVWQYTEGHDKKMTSEEFLLLDEPTKNCFQRIAYLSPTTGVWVMPPNDDPACYTNHDAIANNTSVKVNVKISDEPYFIANREISVGEEITNNYLEFDDNSTLDKFAWLKS